MGDGDEFAGDGLAGNGLAAAGGPPWFPPTRGVTTGESIGIDGTGTGKPRREGSRSWSTLSRIARCLTRCILYKSRICSQFNFIFKNDAGRARDVEKECGGEKSVGVVVRQRQR